LSKSETAETPPLQAVVNALQDWAAGSIGALGTQIWVADDLGFHLRSWTGRASDVDDRRCALGSCLDDQPRIGVHRLALPIALNDRHSAACVFLTPGLVTPEMLAPCQQRLLAMTAELEAALQRERIARLSGTARRSDGLRTCLALAHRLEHCAQLRPVLAEMHGALGEFLPAENFFVVLLDEARRWLHFEYFVDQFDVDENPIAFHEGRLQGSLSAIVVAAGRVVRGSSAELLAQAGVADTEESQQFGPSAHDWLGVPIMMAGEAQGAIVVQSYQPDVSFDDSTPSVLSMIAEAVAAALQRRRTREVLERTVRERTAELSNSLDALHATQRQLLEAEKHAALGRLVSGVAHELNTPLGTALTASTHLADALVHFEQQCRLGTMHRADLTAFTELVRNSAELQLRSLQRAIDLVQRFRQIAAGDRLGAAQPFELRSLLQELIGLLQPRLQAAGHQLHWNCPGGIVLLCAPDSWLELLRQLIDNAMNHAFGADTGGTIRLQISRSGDTLICRFSDDGKGFAEGAVARAFDAFFTTARQHGHVGLGLHLVHNIVTQVFGGTVQLSSSAGAGSELSWSVPLG
jgi:signal transduction histidine kinase